ncbi:MAG: hypothetical protein A2842_02315 [Candidatus Wildermuthbacteria bacterium RIFCSPHIGHO2_01_FULL_48_25]|uniref:DUF4446 domain-containing protein n=2 Tax=Parcubacteria group TaxID=1794811 RepID=A0A1F8HA78_9BACT|nr:MAG: hypothetical protein A3I39_00910 [Candidatus Yanofskybacteria bacterium RIFCSPLOWO2_02_FULL_47_9b]OHA64106.1 MAG: hypothetical protein A2842_02315 [Candidatus Wildermuthbacteria bacterium RIFCSPHIGHO2_01_FULL_48_25]OHA69313.1 MAG: hypothetical protein A3J57_00255 [Candidatus Wildermuthbacteria bacterium RIFCSPHIGHO2_02_FULL_49_12b]OHA73202.1 MAG: hypothetical protein A3B24_01040 [Candidatus Wildermuthbacteria bacterium RIFCSPLOWO2_01_FULL_48_16]
MFFKAKKKKFQGVSKEVEKHLEGLEKKLEELSQELADFKKGMKKAVTKVGIIRYNPFGEGGGDQSFSAAFLDEDNNGVVLTSHYLQEYNRMYGKPVQAGKSEYALSKEEEEAIKKALHESR